jgi:DNA-binding NtrC family response regulator
MAEDKKNKIVDLLLVDDDDELRNGLIDYFRQLGYRAEGAASAELALPLLRNRSYHVAVFDFAMPGMTGVELLKQIKSENSETEIILLTGEGTIETAVDAMKLGAFDFLTKPVRTKSLEAVVRRAAEANSLRSENRRLKALVERSTPQYQMIGDSPAMQKVRKLISRVAPSDNPILIQGESGTGKELVARALHLASTRADKPLVVINCAALPEQLLESELFGHEKGAFTGANTSKPGLFEVAEGGTLFIDEIGELALALQPKLLRVLEDGSMRRVGSLKERRVDVRIIAATNRDLQKEVEHGRFREDLYYRINVMTIHLPPLRERGDDVNLLADHFCGQAWELEPAARQALVDYRWPGNVRQLINALERAKMLADDEVLKKEQLPPEVVSGASLKGAPGHDGEFDGDLASLNRAHVVQTLRRENGNKLRAAKALGVTRRSLYRLLEKYQIDAAEIAEV